MGLLELSRTRWRDGRDVLRLAVTAAWLAAPLLALLALMRGTGGAIGGQGSTWNLTSKLLWISSFANGYNWVLSACLGAGAIAALYVLFRNRLANLDKEGRWIAAGFAVLYVVMPFRLFDTAFVDVRVVVAAVLVLPAFVTLAGRGGSLRRRLGYAATVVLLVNAGFVAHAQLTYDSAYDELRRSFRHLAPASRVLVGTSGDAQDPPKTLLDYPMYNAPVLAAEARDAFVPTLFTAAGKQPIVARAAVRQLDVPYGGPVPVAILRDIALHPGHPASAPRFIADWEEDYDYLYVVGTPGANPMPELLERLDSGARFTLYRIR